MIRKYKVKRRYEDTQYVCGMDAVKDIVYDPVAYKDNCWDSILEGMDERYSGFEFNGLKWTCSEVLGAMDADYLNDWALQEAECMCEENLPYEYDDQIEDLDIGEELEISETGYEVELVELIPENADEVEELGSTYTNIVNEASALL